MWINFFKSLWVVDISLIVDISPSIISLHSTLWSSEMFGDISSSMSHTYGKYSSSEVAQSCLTLCDPMDCSPPGSLVHGIFQAWILEWVAISFSRGSSRPWDWIQVSSIVGRRFTVWATREVHEKHRRVVVSFKRMSVEIFYRWNLLPRSQLANYIDSWRQEAAKKGPTGKYLGYPIRSSYSASVDLKWSSSTVE